MKRFSRLILLILMCLGGCSADHFAEINPHQPFVATVNIGEPSLTFYDTAGNHIATWPFDKAYTGGTLIQQDRILMYGHQLTEAHLYELSSGKKIKTLKTGIGTTNAYYDEASRQFYLTNSESNTVTSYDMQGRKGKQQKLYNYPMSMTAYDGKLYVINYKDTVLSVLDSHSLKVVDEWKIEPSSHGLQVVKEQMWMGGHGQGAKPNETIDVYDLQQGILQRQIHAPLMPIAFARHEDNIAVISHGTSMLYEMTTTGELAQEIKIGANPFAVAYFHDRLVVAGYDDHMLYMIEEGQVLTQVKTNEGPFQLIVRENRE